jgi:hypothetical protein
MTTTYYEFIGKEPSLNDLHEFIEIHNELFDDINVYVIEEYLKFCKDYYGYYYVGGQIKILPTEPIKTEIINKAREINDKAQPDHMMEKSSLIHSKNNLNNLEKILDVYYQYKLVEYYAPPLDSFDSGGEGYKKVAEETIIGKNISKLMDT